MLATYRFAAKLSYHHMRRQRSLIFDDGPLIYIFFCYFTSEGSLIWFCYRREEERLIVCAKIQNVYSCAAISLITSSNPLDDTQTAPAL